jgi:hypothetical protein
MGDTFHRIHQKLNQTNAKLKTNAPPLHKQTGPRTALHKDNKTHESLADGYWISISWVNPGGLMPESSTTFADSAVIESQHKDSEEASFK